MARESMMVIDCSKYSEKIMDIIDLFFSIDWKYFNDKNQVEYLPLGDDDEFDWQESELSKEKVRELVQSKQRHSEQVGLNLYHADSKVGISFLAKDTKNIILSLNINRKTMNGTKESVTDVSWYLHNVIEKLELQGCMIEHFTFEEYLG